MIRDRTVAVESVNDYPLSRWVYVGFNIVTIVHMSKYITVLSRCQVPLLGGWVVRVVSEGSESSE